MMYELLVYGEILENIGKVGSSKLLGLEGVGETLKKEKC